jgi:predicted NBD/HSP70 family sugar kinase
MRRESASPVPARAVGTDVRRNNLQVILRHLATAGPASRATIAAMSGLTRATVSRLALELIAAGLVAEGERTTGGHAGRPSTALHLDGRHVLAMGAEINVDYLALQVVDLSGRTAQSEERAFDAQAAGPDETLRALGAMCRDAIAGLGEHTGGRPIVLSGVGIAIPALVDASTGTATEAPNLHWHDVGVAAAMRRELDVDGVPIEVGNDANFSAIAEYRLGACAGVADLIYVTGEVGIGGGVIIDGRPLLGRHGHGGEVGHMKIDRAGPRCGCGRRGCWEASIGLTALLRAVGVRASQSTSPRAKVATVADRAAHGDARTLRALEEIGVCVGLGAANLANVFDPQAIVLGGYFVELGEWILPSAASTLAAETMAPSADVPVLTTSVLGYTAAAQGAAIHVLDRVFADPVRLIDLR